jgi:short-subunit dehydrogenase
MSKNYIMITGAGGGLGKAFVMECASRGWNLFLTDRNERMLMGVSRTIQSVFGTEVLYYQCDLSDDTDRNRMYKYINESGLSFSGLINIAGLDHEGGFESRTISEIKEIMSVNVMAVLELTHAVLACRDRGSLYLQINVCSMAGYYPMPLKAVYAAGKRFLLDFTLALREEITSTGARVTALCPAGLPTHSEVIKSIDSQGVMGKLTTWNVGDVAHLTVSSALRNKAVVIPGFINRLLVGAGHLLPGPLIARTVRGRWEKTRALKAKRMIKTIC